MSEAALAADSPETSLLEYAWAAFAAFASGADDTPTQGPFHDVGDLFPKRRLDSLRLFVVERLAVAALGRQQRRLLVRPRWGGRRSDFLRVSHSVPSKV